MAAPNFGWEYPPGSMRGSGIYTEDWDSEWSCPECEKETVGTFVKNDWGSVAWYCAACDGEVEIDPSDFGPEPDEAPEDWDHDPRDDG